MSETAKEFLKSASSVPQNYRSTVGVVSILQKRLTKAHMLLSCEMNLDKSY